MIYGTSLEVPGMPGLRCAEPTHQPQQPKGPSNIDEMAVATKEPSTAAVAGNTLEEQTLSRKEKLASLRKRKAEADAAPPSAVPEDPAVSKKREFRFRNYDPTINGPKRHDPSLHAQETVEEKVKDLVANVTASDEIIRASELDLAKIQPKKPNWDLKRDLSKKLSKLEPMTQAAFATLIRRRMQAEGTALTDEGSAALVREMNTDRNPTDDQSDASSDGEN
ncbi:hypothetical protein VP01_807g16 [Puccinia sorghi]|uniref:Coiled-coil domain-containing protein 12 n=1 Tax=Puccinia sorghi TaxID=27349 RepID=A0A0L6UAE9_9BASI|nr:hypothetical protein VP01_807g16 [Puccinia sorghi]